MKKVNLALASLLAVALLTLGVLAMAYRCKTDALRAADNSHLVESYIKQDPRFAGIEVWPRRYVMFVMGRSMFESTPGFTVWGTVPSQIDLSDLKAAVAVHARYDIRWDVRIGQENKRTGSEQGAAPLPPAPQPGPSEGAR